MAEDGTVTVRGEAMTRGRPDGVHLIIEVSVLEQAIDTALQEAADRSNALEDVFEELGITEESRTTSGLLVAEEHEYEDGRSVHRGYRARNQIAVRLADPALAGPLMRGATERAQARIQGPWWTLGTDHPARLEACRHAAEQARSKAEAYAAALGVRLGSVVGASELGTARVGFQSLSRRMAFSVASMSDEGPDLELQQGDLDVFAAVDVTFRLEPE